MSDKENELLENNQFDEEPDFSKLKKKKKSKKKVDFDTEADAAEQPEEPVDDAPQDDDAEADPDAMFADLKKKKKKKSKPVEDDAAEEGAAPEGAEEDLDFGALKKKKKKKKNMAEFEAELAEQQGGDDDDNNANDDSTKASSEEAWLKSDRDYTYDELLGRVFDILRQNNPELVGEKKRYTIVPPSIHREGNKKTIFANVADISKRLHREPEHVIQFLFAELGTTGSVDGAQRLIIKGRFQQKQIENVLRRYIVEYVTCKTCKSPDTIMTKDNRLYFVQCESCGSTRSVTAIKTGFKAQTKEDRRALRA
ncbi:domain found in IF2B/IF5-domain-containing protein [Absidia repens]|uniref:Domain found in IF2B/IF5-domain-containing protein n=1 Tax=Absidia repens TaxID=90262 RepID=A0A1X2IX48_9FUNG|nr:domain found in IF2B/IF5-domain-containing protein [Absidia repens]